MRQINSTERMKIRKVPLPETHTGTSRLKKINRYHEISCPCTIIFSMKFLTRNVPFSEEFLKFSLVQILIRFIAELIKILYHTSMTLQDIIAQFVWSEMPFNIYLMLNLPNRRWRQHKNLQRQLSVPSLIVWRAPRTDHIVFNYSGAETGIFQNKDTTKAVETWASCVAGFQQL